MGCKFLQIFIATLILVHTHTHLQLQADHVVVAVGLDPNTQLSKSSRLETDPQYGGYRVNAELQACSDVWVVRNCIIITYTPHT